MLEIGKGEGRGKKCELEEGKLFSGGSVGDRGEKKMEGEKEKEKNKL